jgi:hypothetical protein
MRGFLSVRKAKAAALFFLLTAACSSDCLFAAEDSGKEILCPNATCKGTLELALNGAAPELFADMLFVHGDAAEGISSSNGKITLKSIMLCEQNGKSVHFAAKHVGNATLSGQGTCQMTLNGSGIIKNDKLVETGKAQLRCADNSTRQGTYTIRAAGK